MNPLASKSPIVQEPAPIENEIELKRNAQVQEETPARQLWWCEKNLNTKKTVQIGSRAPVNTSTQEPRSSTDCDRLCEAPSNPLAWCGGQKKKNNNKRCSSSFQSLSRDERGAFAESSIAFYQHHTKALVACCLFWSGRSSDDIILEKCSLCSTPPTWRISPSSAATSLRSLHRDIPTGFCSSSCWL